ncbi:TIGR00730 family Rossman fold protein [Glycomyces sp. A-F 0318]|uniref:LOG family protein n=1 Tax=Glycomyces amatae TaxID=2881355 RepID=UPI001E30C957|nr:TIGR00730 family Rossman fold protein [Glycomyces amatae]MCD0446572.1 TIGR00730 family Rossman fold protein [Glycomyces amatae]
MTERRVLSGDRRITADQHLLDIAHEEEWKQRAAWRIMKFQAEFVEGFDAMEEADLGDAIGVYGSARTPVDSEEYKLGVELGRKLGEAGFSIITGGGPGTMEAANRGAVEAGVKSVGLGIELPFEQGINEFVHVELDFKYFFVRKVMFLKYSCGFCALPGGFGTMDELFESLTLVQTGKVGKFPIALIGTGYWGGLADWLRNSMLAEGKISPKDVDLLMVTDDLDEAVDHMRRAGGPDE